MLSFYDIREIQGSHPIISPYFSEGAFGMEAVKHGERLGVRYFSESRRVPFPVSSPLPTFEYTHVYQALPARATCFPFSFAQYFPLQKLRKLPGNAWVQVLAKKRSERWREMVTAQYDAHLTGVKNPSSFSMVRRAQEWIAEKVQEAGDWAEGGVVIPQAEQKEAEDGYQVSIRIAVQGERRMHKHILPFLEALFVPLSDVNEFKIETAAKSLLKNMEERTFAADDSKSFILCTSELRAFFPEPVEKQRPIREVGEEIENEPVSECESESAPEWKPDPPYEERALPASPVPHRIVAGRMAGGAAVATAPEPPDAEDAEIEQSKRKLEKAMRKVGILEGKLEVVRTDKGPTLQQMTIKLPRGVKFNAIANQRLNLQTELGVEGVMITQGTQAGTANILFQRESRDTVWLEPLLQSEAFKKYAKENDLAFINGVDPVGTPIFESLARVHNIMVTGAKGGGKTELTMGMVYTWLSFYGPDEVEITIIDPKFIDFPFFDIGFPQINGVINHVDLAVDILESLPRFMDERYETMQQAGVRSPKAYREKTGKPMPYKIIIIDEYADLYIQDRDVENYIIRLGQKARACGLFTILCTQRPAATIVNGNIKGNFNTRYCFNLPQPSDYQTVFGKQMSPGLLGMGDGLSMIEGKNGFNRFQSPLLAANEDDLQSKLIILKERWVGKEEAEEEEQEELLAKLHAYIQETGELRLREIQKHMGVRMAATQNLMQRLVGKGLLLGPDDENPRYRLASDEEK